MMKNPWVRVAVTAGAVVTLALLAGLYRVFESHGVFTAVRPGFEGVCRAVGGVVGPADIAIDGADKIAFVSVNDRRARDRSKPAPQDGLYSYAYTQDGARLRKLQGTPTDFHPQGISLYRGPDGLLTLLAVNHRTNGDNSVDVFTATVKDGAAELQEIGSIAGGVLSNPNDMAAIDEDSFYVVNTTKGGLARFFADALVLPDANILYFDGIKFVAVAGGLNSPNGATLSRDGRLLYVSEAYPRALLTFERNEITGALKLVSTFAIPSNLDKIQVASDGSLWIGSHPKAFAMAVFRRDPERPAPSEIFRVETKGGIPQRASLVYANRGEEIGGSSVGAVADGHLLIGSPFDNHILDCRMR